MGILFFLLGRPSCCMFHLEGIMADSSGNSSATAWKLTFALLILVALAFYTMF